MVKGRDWKQQSLLEMWWSKMIQERIKCNLKKKGLLRELDAEVRKQLEVVQPHWFLRRRSGTGRRQEEQCTTFQCSV